MAPDPAPHLPLKPVDLHLLLALSQEELHGYGLVQAIEASTAGLIRLDPGNLYRVIKRLLAEGLVAEGEGRRRTSDDRDDDRRRYYRLTALGHRVLAAELQRLASVVRSPAARTIVRGWAT